MSTTFDVKPIRPWAASPKDRFMTGLSLAISAAITIAIVLFTPMKGKLAYFFLFFLSWFIVDSFFVARRYGRKGIKDALASKVTLFGAVVVSMAVFSMFLAFSNASG